MKKTIVTVVIELEESNIDEVEMLIDVCLSPNLRKTETYNIVNIEDIEE